MHRRCLPNISGPDPGKPEGSFAYCAAQLFLHFWIIFSHLPRTEDSTTTAVTATATSMCVHILPRSGNLGHAKSPQGQLVNENAPNESHARKSPPHCVPGDNPNKLPKLKGDVPNPDGRPVVSFPGQTPPVR